MNLLLQFIGAGLLLVGLWISGNHRKSGPALAAIAEVILVIASIPNGVWGIVFLCVVLFVVQGRNFIKWHREGVPW